jgi:FlaA1/EpsC-like NDP-sugar epimerase
VIPLLGTLDWRSFLARPRLPSPSLEVLDTLYRQPTLITGAGGSIGSALALRLAALAPPSLLLLDASESRMYALRQAWTSAGVAGEMTPILGSVTDRTLLDEVFTVHAPRIVFHAAAFKHVPLMEEQPLAAIANNVFGTLTLTTAAAARGARVVLLSTDKAVEPASVMGATKRIAERIVLAAGGIVLRLGNVLATRDSVTETFARQITLGQSLTVTDPAARRYFVTLDEAVNLLLIAAAEPRSPSLLAPEITAPHFITDLAHFMAHTLVPERSVELDFTSPRPGDKESELLWSATETAKPAGESGLVSIDCPALPEGQLEASLAALRTAVDTRDLAAALVHLCAMVPDYTPSAAVMALSGRRVSS